MFPKKFVNSLSVKVCTFCYMKVMHNFSIPQNNIDLNFWNRKSSLFFRGSMEGNEL